MSHPRFPDSAPQECRQLKAQAAPRRKPPAVQLVVQHVLHDADNDNDAFVLSVAPPPSGACQSVTTSYGVTASEPSVAADSLAAAGASTTGGIMGAAEDHQPTDILATSISPALSPVAPGLLRPLSMRSASSDSFSLPNSSADVERVWRSLRRQPEEFGRYALRLSAELAARIFKHNLPAEILSALLAAIDDHFFPAASAQALHTLRALSTVNRFSILTMCLEKADIKAIDSIFGKLAAEYVQSSTKMQVCVRCQRARWG